MVDGGSTENKGSEQKKEIIKVPLTGVLEILANKVSRKAVIVAMAMVLIYLLAATPNVAEVIFFIVAIAGLAVFFTLLQWILDVRGEKRGKNARKDPPSDDQI